MDCLVGFVWQKHGPFLANRRVTVLDSLFTSIMSDKFITFSQKRDRSTFQWHPLLVAYVRGVVDGRRSKLEWLKDVDTVYLPMNWGKKHWVSLAVDILKGHIDIRDPFEDLTSSRKVVSYMTPIAQMLPALLRSVCGDVPSDWPPTAFTFLRIPGLAQNLRGGDCGPMAIKFIELHSHNLSTPLFNLTVQQVNNLRVQYAIALYATYVSPI